MLTVAHSELTCVLPPGTGAVDNVTVSVLGQSGTVATPSLAYAPPALVALAPSLWPTDVSALSVTLTGRGFGVPSQSSLVEATVRSNASCGPDVAIQGQAPTVRSDGEALTLQPLRPAR